MADSTGTAREEAERLVATVLAMASGRGASGLGDLVSGAARRVGDVVDDVVRDPSPEAAARLAAGVGDIASGVANVMRAVSIVAAAGGTDRPRRDKAPRPEPTPDQSWSAATRATAGPAQEPAADPAGDPWGAATRDDTAAAHRAAAAASAAAAEAAAAAVQAAAEAARKAAEERKARAAAARKAAEEPARPGKPVTRPTDVWAAAVANAANDYSPVESAVAGSSGVDHDVAAQGTPAPADDRADRPGSETPGRAE